MNYLSHFLIVAHLLPTMKVSGNDCRIILVSGEAHKKAKGFDPDYAAGKIPHNYDGYRMFAKTKLYQVSIQITIKMILCMHIYFIFFFTKWSVKVKFSD